MIRVWQDHEGDPVAVDTARIVGVSVGDVTGPRRGETGLRVTLIWCDGIAQPFMVADSFDDVVSVWEAGRKDAEEMRGWRYLPIQTGGRG